MIANRDIEALIFDFDGLVIDTEWPAYQSWKEVYEAHGCEFTLEIWSKVLGGSGAEWDHVAYLSRRTGVALDPEAVRSARFARKLAMIEQETICPGIVEYLEHARRLNLRTVIVSSAGRNWVVPFLDRLGLAGRFDPIVCGEDAERVKPYPDLYERALEWLGLPAHRCVVFEDSPNGVVAAQSAGLRCIAVPNRASALLPMPECHLIVKSLGDLPFEEFLSCLGSVST